MLLPFSRGAEPISVHWQDQFSAPTSARLFAGEAPTPRRLLLLHTLPYLLQGRLRFGHKTKRDVAKLETRDSGVPQGAVLCGPACAARISYKHVHPQYFFLQPRFPFDAISPKMKVADGAVLP